MAWQYEIANGDPLNKRWYAFCELANALRARIILTDGDDTNAPSYTKPDASTTKTPAITDFIGEWQRDDLLEDNIDTFRGSILLKSTDKTTAWCDLAATKQYISAAGILTDGSYGSTWLPHTDINKPNYWAQLFEAMETVRYLFWPWQYDEWPISHSVTSEVGSAGGSGSSISAAWSDYASHFTSSTTTSLLTGNSRSLAAPYDEFASTYYIDSWITGNWDRDNYDFDGFYDGLIGTPVDSGYSFLIYVSITAAENSAVSWSGLTFNHPYGSYNISGSVSEDWHEETILINGSAAGAEIHGNTTISPAIPLTSSQISLSYTGGTDGVNITIDAGKRIVNFVPGASIDKAQFSYYVTDLASELDYI